MEANAGHEKNLDDSPSTLSSTKNAHKSRAIALNRKRTSCAVTVLITFFAVMRVLCSDISRLKAIDPRIEVRMESGAD
jgi:hypothetical protein